MFNFYNANKTITTVIYKSVVPTKSVYNYAKEIPI